MFSGLIGNTPLLEIHYHFDNKPRRIFAKYESLNMTGSIKDRMAAYIIEQAYERCELKAGDTIVEASSGNTGISLSAIGRAFGYNVRIYMPDWMSKERTQLMCSFGTTVVPVSKKQGGFIGSVEMAEEFAEQNSNVFLPCQFCNDDNVKAHESSTGPEIHRQLASRYLTMDAFVAGVGTGGTVMGVGRFARKIDPNIRVHPLEPANSQTLRTGKKSGSHRIQGISDEFIPDIVKLDELDDIIDVWDGDAILMAQMLAQKLGLPVGISSGANVIGAMTVLEQMDEDAVVVTVLPDSNKKYLSTDLCCVEPSCADYVTQRVRLDRFCSIQ